VVETEVVPQIEGSALALSLLELGGGEAFVLRDDACDSLVYVRGGLGALALGGAQHELDGGSAALVLAGEEATLSAGEDGLAALRATVGPDTDRHASLGPRDAVVRPDATGTELATGLRSFRLLFGPHNGSTRATLFIGYVPPGRVPWHYHLYDEIVCVEGPARVHLEGSETLVAPGEAVRLRPRQLHVVENEGAEDLTVLGVFTPAGSPSAAYVPAGQ
jgi:quercetin dioxygenase-like cupin family protein